MRRCGHFSRRRSLLLRVMERLTQRRKAFAGDSGARGAGFDRLSQRHCE